VGYSEDDFGSAVESRDKVRRGIVLRRIGCGAQTAQLEHCLLLVDENIVRLDISVHNIQLLEWTQERNSW